MPDWRLFATHSWLLFLLGGLLLLVGGVLLWRVLRALAIRRQYRRWRPYVRRPAIEAAWNRFIPPAVDIPGSGPVDLFSWLKVELNDPQPVQTRYLLVGPPESGRSTALLRLAAKRLWRGQVVYRHLGQPGALESLSQLPQPDQTLLLLDGLDEAYALRRGFRSLMDQLLAETAPIGRMILAASPALIPAPAAGDTQPQLYHFVGDQQYRVFLRLQLLPWPRKLLLKRWRRHLPGRKARRAAASLLDTLPGLMSWPGWTQALPAALAAEVPPRGQMDLTAAEIHAWVGRQRAPETA
ncbi:MAG: hypothetical protein D6722_25910, partial [Bacteroidetes bacterium]